MSGEVAHKSHKKEYFFIFGLLTFLTIVEILVAEMKMATLTKGINLTVLAVGKAFLVAYYFMHLKEEKKWLKFIAAVPITAGIYATVLCLEIVMHKYIQL